MKSKWNWLVFLLINLFGISLLFAQEAPFKDDKELTSYSLGVQTARTLMKDDPELNRDFFIKGFKDAASGAKLPMTEDELRKILNKFQEDIRRTLKMKHAVESAANLKNGKVFLEENKSKTGVVVLPSGVQYQVIKEGSGLKPLESDMVLCHYKGTLISGKQFDASPEGTPATLPVAKMIPGFKEALQLMSVGSKWKIFIPSAQAYGPRSVGMDIGPNETLIFEVELVDIKQN